MATRGVYSRELVIAWEKWFALIFSILLSWGCSSTGSQKAEFLMPAPVAITEGAVEPSVSRQYLENSNEVSVFYATNRKPSSPGDGQYYVTDLDQNLKLGNAIVRIGDEHASPSEIFTEAVSLDRKKNIPLTLKRVTQQALFAEQSDLNSLPRDTQAYFEAINTALLNSRNRDLTVYVHGANTTFYRSAVQAAQFRYFTGRQSVILAFSWPSTGSLLHYGRDVKNAARSYEVFARLIRLLSLHTEASQINILSYSAGARIASPALKLLADSDSEELRLGMIYYAEPDEYQHTFFQNLAHYLPLTLSTTVTVNFHDSVLAFAEIYNAKPDAGKPDPEKFSDSDRKELIKKLDKPNFSVINIDGTKIPGLDIGEHSAWYNHPWVSSDVITHFLFQLAPDERGLEEKTLNRPWKKYWVFPGDYPDRIRALLPALE
jgi:esterase/lipase superfamily enzyme